MKYQKENLPLLTKPVLSAEEEETTTTVEISGRYQSLIIANELLINISQFNKWNPGLQKQLAEGKKYSLRIPKDKLGIFEAKKSQLLAASLRALLEGNIPAKQ